MTENRLNSGSGWWVFVFIGSAGGFLAGMFGVGGGIIMVPALVIFAGMTQRVAAATSLAAIIPAAAIGCLGYAFSNQVDWLAALVLAVGAVIGAQLGTYLMSRIPQSTLLWFFVSLQAVLVVSLWFSEPDRGASMTWNFVSALALFLLGTFTGTIAGLLGVGGGLVVVPALIIFFGSSDLVAKGTSLVMMIPGALSGTLANYRRSFVDVRSATITGLAAAALTPLGALAAHAVDPQLGNILLSLLLAFAAIRMVMTHLKQRRETS